MIFVPPVFLKDAGCVHGVDVPNPQIRVELNEF